MANSPQRDDLLITAVLAWIGFDASYRVDQNWRGKGEERSKVWLRQWKPKCSETTIIATTITQNHIEEFGLLLHGAILSNRILSFISFARRTINLPPMTSRHPNAFEVVLIYSRLCGNAAESY